MILNLAPILIAVAGLLTWLLPKPTAPAPTPRLAVAGLVIFTVGLLFSVANLTGQHVLFR